jgi:hypothetical protein
MYLSEQKLTEGTVGWRTLYRAEGTDSHWINFAVLWMKQFWFSKFPFKFWHDIHLQMSLLWHWNVSSPSSHLKCTTTLKKDVICSSKTLVTIYKTAVHHSPDHNQHNYGSALVQCCTFGCLITMLFSADTIL